MEFEEGVRRQKLRRQNQLVRDSRASTNCGHRADGGDLYPIRQEARSLFQGTPAQQILDPRSSYLLSWSSVSPVSCLLSPDSFLYPTDLILKDLMSISVLFNVIFCADNSL